MNGGDIGLPLWVTNPQIVINLVLEHQFELMLFGGLGIVVFLTACLVIGRMLNRDPKKKRNEFGKDVWADEKVLRNKGFISKDL